jgi:hypothetical protein
MIECLKVVDTFRAAEDDVPPTPETLEPALTLARRLIELLELHGKTAERSILADTEASEES